MNKSKIVIEFYTSDLVDLPEKCLGASFSFHGVLQNLGNLSVEGNSFTINIEKQVSPNRDESVQTENPFKLARGHSNEIQTETDDCLIYDVLNDELNSDNSLNYSVKNMTFIPGVICMSFKNSCPFEYTISTLTQFVRNVCNGNWLNTLEKIITDLHITDLYTVGEKQKRMIQNYVKIIPIYVWPKPPMLSHCPKCLFYGCSQFKTKVILHDICFRKLIISCE